MSAQPHSRDELIELVKSIRAAQFNRLPHNELVAEFERTVPDSDVENLCRTDYPHETVVDICLGLEKTKRKLRRDELLQLVRDIFKPTPNEAEHILMVLTFDYNCRHPHKNGLIFYPEDAFDGRSDPTPEEIVEKAIRGE